MPKLSERSISSGEHQLDGYQERKTSKLKNLDELESEGKDPYERDENVEDRDLDKAA